MYGAVKHPPSREDETVAEPVAPPVVSRSTAARYLVVGGLVVVGLACVGVSNPSSGVLTLNSFEPRGQSLAARSTVVDDSGIPVISFSNEYERNVLGHQIGDGLFWDHLVQRHKETLVEVDTDCTVAWDVTNPDGTAASKYAGASTTMVFTELGMHNLDMTLSCDDADSVKYSYSVMSKHVRYEIRTLTSKDREDFFDALQVVYNTNQKDGEAKYGKKFRSIEFLVREHLYGAAAKDCDHWHDDAGILTHHMGFTLELEQSLQSIQPTVGMPYWDYTIDAYNYTSETWMNSPIFNDDWFGPVESGSDDHVITKGRWAYQSVMQNAQEWSGVHNPYGLLRSPWNTNPVPYITRSRYTYGVKDGGWTTPDCLGFAEVAGFDWIGDFFSALNGELHGPIHIMIGGQWDYESSVYNVSAAVHAIDLKQMADSFLLASKYLWRQGFLRCPESCAADTPISDCQCSCDDYVKDFSSDDAYDFLNDHGIYNSLPQWEDDNFVAKGGWNDPKNLLEFVCHVGHAGEMFTSAAPYDPTFWPLHGVAERFMSYKRVAAQWGITTINETWGYEHSTIMSDTHVVCDWDNVKHLSNGKESMELPTCTKSICSGHKMDDLLPMGDFLGDGSTYSNIEFYEFTAPWNDELPYMYDSYTSWPACSDQNEYFFPETDPMVLAQGLQGTAAHIAAGRMKAGFANDRRLR